MRLLRAAFLGGISAVAAGQDVQPPSDVPTLPPVRVEATPPPTTNFYQPEDTGLTGTILDGTIFSNLPAEGYFAPTTSSGTIIAIPDADLPLTVNPITRQLLDDQIALQVTDIYRNAGGVNLLGDSQFADRLLLRGQQVTSSNYRKDGFIDRTAVPRDFQNVERIEILKGPASVLYGAGDAAGLVNVITKKPLYDRFAVAGYTFGAYGQDRFTADVNGIATQSGNLLYRLNAAQEDRANYVDFDYLSRTQIAPVVTWLMNDSTTLTWNGEWHRDERLGYQGVPALGGNALALPPSRYVGEPANDFVDGHEIRQSLVLNHQISDCWFFNIGGYSLFTETPLSLTAASAPLIPLPFPPFTPIEPEFNRLRSDAPFQNEQTQSMIANLGGEFSTGELYHKTLVGMEYAYLDSQSIFNASTPWTGGFSGPFPVPPFPAPFVPTPLPFNVANPTYTDPDTIFLFGLETEAFRQQRVGGYLQDLVEINPYWQVLGGVRFDTVDFEFDRTINVGGVATELETVQTFNRVSPRGGVVYQPWGDESLAVYYSYTQAFSPPEGGAYFTAGPLNPVLSEGHEAGFKTELLPGLTFNAAGFHTVRQNDTFVVTPSIITQVGEVRSQGAELNLLGAITDDWSVVANYCYCDARITDPLLGLDGFQARNVPYNTANVWSRYNVIDNECVTAGAAVGLVYVGERESAIFPTGVQLPGFSRWDGGLYYRRGAMNTMVYLENLFDIQYAQSSASQYQIFQGAPFNVRAMVTYAF